jgi:predicted membrane-bound mannosyltransferase
MSGPKRTSKGGRQPAAARQAGPRTRRDALLVPKTEATSQATPSERDDTLATAAHDGSAHTAASTSGDVTPTLAPASGGYVAVAARALTPPPASSREVARRDDDGEMLDGAPIRPDRLQAAWGRIRSLSFESWLWIGVLALAALLRFWGLGDKPLHHDESMHAYFSLTFAQSAANYAYDPLLHGPFQFHAEGLMFSIIMTLQHIFAARAIGNPWINDTTARFVPALFGLAIVALPYGLRRELGRTGALIAAFLLAVSPSFVYFSRFLREDIYFNFFIFAMVVCAVRYAHRRTLGWFVALTAATVLAYTTFEGIFLTLLIFLGFLGLLLIWELSHTAARAIPATLTERQRLFFGRAGLIALASGLAGVAALIGLRTLNQIAVQITTNTAQSDQAVRRLEDNTVAVVLWVSILIALLVIAGLVWQMLVEEHPAVAPETGGDQLPSAPPLLAMTPTVARIDAAIHAPGRGIAAVRARLDPDRQPFLRLLTGISWTQWFIAFVVGWLIFAGLFWIFPGAFVSDGTVVRSFSDGFQRGVGRGIWQGLYYWLQQQHVARGGQPWYYYLLLIPLYEQLAVVFGLAGIVYSFLRPTRFRLFLVWWFLGSLVLYSWASEKMPWLAIHILLPLMLLAAIALDVVLKGCYALIQRLADRDFAALRAAPARPAGVALAGLLALFLLVPMLNGMLILSQRDAANGPQEMMVYVQTTQDVDHIMSYIAQADKKLYGGTHQISIGVGPGQEWPFYWYLLNYPNTHFQYQAGSKTAPPVDVMILDPGGQANGADAQGFLKLYPTGYQTQQYRLRAWWDETYKPARPPHPDAESQFIIYGVGLGNYLTYGSFPPAKGAHFDLATAAGRVWAWVWTRQPLGDVHGSTDFVTIVRDGMPRLPAPTPPQQ